MGINKSKMAVAAISKNTQKGVSPSNFDFHQIWYADRYGKGTRQVQHSIFWKFKMTAATILKNTQKCISRRMLDRFAPYFVCR